MAKKDATDATETESQPRDAANIIDVWFNETFYNQAIDTAAFNMIQSAVADLKTRFA